MHFIETIREAEAEYMHDYVNKIIIKSLGIKSIYLYEIMKRVMRLQTE